MALAFNQPMASDTLHLDRLTDAERRVLRMLAEGHTAKSIARATGSTPAAVNERLRQARRKTGVGSSRELARLIRSQESRHDEIGMATARRPVAPIAEPAAEPLRPQTEVIGMIALFFVAVVGSAMFLSHAPAPDKQIDPLLGAPMQKGPDPAELHSRVRAEARDPAWAPRMEAAVRARLMQVPLVGIGGNMLRVICATTICEAGGTLLPPASKEEQADLRSRFNRTVSDLQAPPLRDDLAKKGLASDGGSFMGGKGKPDRLVFLLYYLRTPEPPAAAARR
ncbi:helix-turn-helix transcriptional regulator [Sphingomonas sp.]|uniref:helix-turn-helix domain-containing protein n=1 Tax=Sphingomonas sp. TaxID=28214 RepID=UPI0025F87ED9|nr:helix-turn-helix transcriptional regulator [Sphingomonas sp.]